MVEILPVDLVVKTKTSRPPSPTRVFFVPDRCGVVCGGCAWCCSPPLLLIKLLLLLLLVRRWVFLLLFVSNGGPQQIPGFACCRGLS
jgi:hypothetical protein